MASRRPEKPILGGSQNRAATESAEFKAVGGQIWERSDPSQHHLLVLPRRRAPRPRCRFLSFAMNRNSRYRPQTPRPLVPPQWIAAAAGARASSKGRARTNDVTAPSVLALMRRERSPNAPNGRRLGEGPMLRCKLQGPARPAHRKLYYTPQSLIDRGSIQHLSHTLKNTGRPGGFFGCCIRWWSQVPAEQQASSKLNRHY